jgi:lactate dehydrogenase-like 2-hydroxyacid dehydrogenase
LIKIIAPTSVNLNTQTLLELANTPEFEFVSFDTAPKDPSELIERIKTADAILVSYNTNIDRSVIEQSPNLKYIGICGTNLKNIDLVAAQEKKITVKNVYEYSDEGTAEYVFMLLLEAIRGVAKNQPERFPTELYGKTLGLIGLGAVGKRVLSIAKGFNMQVLYNATQVKPEMESANVHFATKLEILAKADIISLHVPKDILALTAEDFKLIQSGKVIINTCLGTVLDLGALQNWLCDSRNLAIYDKTPDGISDLQAFPNFILGTQIAALTVESKARLSQKVMNNLKAFFKI